MGDGEEPAPQAAFVAAASGLVSASPASAHETFIRVGDAVGTVGSGHSGARICELSPNRPGVGYMQVLTANDGIWWLNPAEDGCVTAQFAPLGGIVSFRVGWNQGGGILWSPWGPA
jgi:hypothetical protein